MIDQYDDHQDRWECAPPDVDRWFVVDRCEWNADYTIRTIHAWHPADELPLDRTTAV